MSCPACGSDAAPNTRVGPQEEGRVPDTCGRCLVTTMRLRSEMPGAPTPPAPTPVDIYIPQCSACGAEPRVGRPVSSRAPVMVVPSGWTEEGGELRCPRCR